MSFTRGLLGTLLLMPILPTILWFWHKISKASIWGARQVGTITVDPGGYREGVVPAFAQVEAPAVVRWAAIGAWTLGQLSIPAALLGVYLTLLMYSGGEQDFITRIISTAFMALLYACFFGPGIVLAGRLLVLGSPLLRGERTAAASARNDARFAFVLNGIALLFALLFLVLGLTQAKITASGLLGFTVFISYPLLSILHGVLLRRAAAAIERHHAESEPPSSAGVRIAVEPNAPLDQRVVEGVTQSTDTADPSPAARRG